MFVFGLKDANMDLMSGIGKYLEWKIFLKNRILVYSNIIYKSIWICCVF